jgi:hypothetical protein
MAIMRLGEADDEEAPKDSSSGRLKVTPTARKKVRRLVFMLSVIGGQWSEIGNQCPCFTIGIAGTQLPYPSQTFVIGRAGASRSAAWGVTGFIPKRTYLKAH